MSAARDRALVALALTGALPTIIERTRTTDAVVILSDGGALVAFDKIDQRHKGRARRAIAIAFCGEADRSVIVSRETLRRALG